MHTTLKINETLPNLSAILADVENNLSIVTIIRNGRPVAKIVPVTPKRNLDPLPGFPETVKMRGDWFADNSSEWENA